ncbi:hypothetical protein JXL21_00235 [Candidatus Bathyarchaeota archaeon]|nr:hypothetical protein [Candidatus Bathyarchaeota archaeon]
MQAKSPVSKPLLLVLIGVIVGASLGLGSGYAVFYPEMVNQRSATIEERVTGLEYDIEEINSVMTAMNASLGSVKKSLRTLTTLNEAINSLSTRIGGTEIDVQLIEDEVDSVRGDVAEIERLYGDLLDEWEETAQGYEDLLTSFGSVTGQVQGIELRLEMGDAVDMLRTRLADPGDTVIANMANKIFDTLKGDTDFDTWVNNFGEVPAKNLLRQEITKIKGGLVWNEVSTQALGSDSYLVKVESYFRFEFSAASVSVSQMRMQVRGTVDVVSGEITQVKVDSAEKM